MPLSRISERMKFEVPLMMPAIHSMRFADSPSRSALMMGTPPATAASNATITPFFCAAAKISLPCVARSALFAVTTCLPCRIASSTRSLATVVPPISSTTISTSSPRTTWKASATTFAFSPTILFARSSALSATTEIRIARPARRWISSAFRFKTSQVPPPTMPMPSSPTLIGLMRGSIAAHPEKQMLLYVRPFVHEHAVHHAVAHRAVAPRPVVADHAVLLRAERLDRALRAEVEIVGAQAHDLAVQLFKRVLEKQQLARGIHVAALAARGVPGPADFDAVRGRNDVVVARRAYDRAALQVAHGPGQHLAPLLPFQGVFDIFPRVLRLGNRGEEELPQSSVGCGLDQAFFMLSRQRLEPYAVALERCGLRVDQAAPLKRPSFLNMSRMPRTAWRRRCSFSMSAMRTWSSP